jgi:two-component system sensor histidine kinase HupT/HoxJ
MGGATEARLRQERDEARRQLEVARARLVEQARLVALGRLVAGVAHELNNPANFVYGGSIALSERLEAWPEERRGEDFGELQRLAAVIRTGGERVRDLIRSLLSFSRSATTSRARFDLGEAARSTAALLEPWARRHGVEIQVECEGSHEVAGRRGEVSQVLVNLLTNAIQASQDGAVRLAVTGRGDEVVAAVRDEGPGIEPELGARIFEPFFTTKPEDEGTGLGLAISKTIADDHDGRIEVDSVPGEGSTFALVLPAATDGGDVDG